MTVDIYEYATNLFEHYAKDFKLCYMPPCNEKVKKSRIDIVMREIERVLLCLYSSRKSEFHELNNNNYRRNAIEGTITFIMTIRFTLNTHTHSMQATVVSLVFHRTHLYIYTSMHIG